MRLFTVTAVIGDMVTLDATIRSPTKPALRRRGRQRREATTEELEHGHVHGGGHHH